MGLAVGVGVGVGVGWGWHNALYKNTIQYKIQQDLTIDYPLIENLFIEIESGSLNVCKNVIVGLIYRVPDSDVEVFDNEFTDILEKINKENKAIYITGDYDIGILKHEEHNETQKFLDIIYENTLIPLITKPPRLTCYSKTQIDNIWTNNFKEYLTHESGIIFLTISDHFPVYHILEILK